MYRCLQWCELADCRVGNFEEVSGPAFRFIDPDPQKACCRGIVVVAWGVELAQVLRQCAIVVAKLGQHIGGV
jgi:hypothetical protein